MPTFCKLTDSDGDPVYFNMDEVKMIERDQEGAVLIFNADGSGRVSVKEAPDAIVSLFKSSGA